MGKAEAWVMVPKMTIDKTGVDIDMHPLVLCEDCKYYDGNGTCMKNGIALLTGHWFCADGERRDGDG